MPLTAAAVKNAKPTDKPYKLADAGGLFLLVNPNGSKYWRLKYRYGGKEKLLAVGVYCGPVRSDDKGRPVPEAVETLLAEARQRRDDAKALLTEGKDPGAVKIEAKRQAVVSSENSFEAVAREWHNKNAAKWSADHGARVLKRMEADIFPRIGAMPIADIGTHDLLAALGQVEERGALDLLGRLCQNMVSVMRYAVQTKRIAFNPALDMKGAFTVAKSAHRPALPLERLPELVGNIGGYQGRIITRAALWLTLLTFVRSSELRMMRWSEIDFQRGTWTIPPHREAIEGVRHSHRGAKMKTPHVVPLPRQALELFEQLKAMTGRFEFVFAGDHDPSKPMSENTINNALRGMGYDTKTEVCGHGFRTMACSALNESGQWAEDAIERQMSHQERNGVRAAYIHRAEFLAERRLMMQWWADYLDAQRGGAYVEPIEFAGQRQHENVVQLRRA